MEASGIEPVSAWNRSPNPKYETSTLLTPPLAAWFHPSTSWTKGREVDGNTNLMDGDGAATVRFSVNAGIWHGGCPLACGSSPLAWLFPDRFGAYMHGSSQNHDVA